jgi:hypothetical protein
MTGAAQKLGLKTPQSVWPHSFKEGFCQLYCYKPKDYERAVFWRCLYRHSLPLAAVLYSLKPEFFREDFDFIREVGNITSGEMFKAELNFFYGRNVREKNWLRRIFAIRVSAKRMLKLKNRIFTHPLAGMAILR